jgi:hypothetical protein
MRRLFAVALFFAIALLTACGSPTAGVAPTPAPPTATPVAVATSTASPQVGTTVIAATPTSAPRFCSYSLDVPEFDPALARQMQESLVAAGLTGITAWVNQEGEIESCSDNTGRTWIWGHTFWATLSVADPADREAIGNQLAQILGTFERFASPPGDRNAFTIVFRAGKNDIWVSDKLVAWDEVRDRTGAALLDALDPPATGTPQAGGSSGARGCDYSQTSRAANSALTTRVREALATIGQAGGSVRVREFGEREVCADGTDRFTRHRTIFTVTFETGFGGDPDVNGKQVAAIFAALDEIATDSRDNYQVTYIQGDQIMTLDAYKGEWPRYRNLTGAALFRALEAAR